MVPCPVHTSAVLRLSYPVLTNAHVVEKVSALSLFHCFELLQYYADLSRLSYFYVGGDNVVGVGTLLVVFTIQVYGR
jgi:hypothetical protein